MLHSPLLCVRVLLCVLPHLTPNPNCTLLHCFWLSVFLTVLEFIYSNSCKLSQATVVDVLASAIEYGLDGLAKCCSDFIQAHLTVDTACSAMQVSVGVSVCVCVCVCVCVGVGVGVGVCVGVCVGVGVGVGGVCVRE